MRPLWLAIAQLDDPACFGVLLRSVALTFLATAGLLAGSVWGVHALLADYHWPGWLAGVIGTLGVAVLAFWLFLPAVMLIATLFIDRIAAAVDQRHYPGIAAPKPAPIAEQVWDGAALALQILLLNTVALLLTLFVPAIGWAIAWLVSGWAIGRGLFVAVALRRMDRADAIALYRRRRLDVLVPGMALAFAAGIPGLNLVVPIAGTAAMVHVLNRSAGWR